MNLKQKNGISLIILVITIIVMIILSGTIVASLTISTENANLSVMVNDIAQLQESAKAMYIMENELPIVANATEISRTNILNYVTAENKTTFEEELDLNLESENTTFYQLDLQKAGAGNVEYGTGVNGSDDIYVISTVSLRVYYLKGIEYDGNMYFSISSRLANIISVPSTSEDTSQLTINTSQAQVNSINLESDEDTVAPTLQISSIQTYDEFYVINGAYFDNYGVTQNNGAQVRYDYKNYNEVENDFDEEYMKNNAKIATLDETGAFSLKVTKDVKTLTIAAIDKAGNIVMQDVVLE